MFNTTDTTGHRLYTVTAVPRSAEFSALLGMEKCQLLG